MQMESSILNRLCTKVDEEFSRWWKQTDGQDLIEYALMAGFIAVAVGAIMPNISNSISTIFSKIISLLIGANSQGS